ncbi:MAG: hypothetical protein WCS77_06085 [Elusimicrobiaceae bacterium]
MRKLLFAVALALPLGAANAAENKYEAGFVLGEPTGLSWKMNVSSQNAVDLGLAWSFESQTKISVHSDYLWYMHNLLHVEKGSLPVYFGVGARIKMQDKPLLGARFPFGIQYYEKSLPFTVFAEVAPILDILHETKIRLNAGIGLRYLF